MSLLLERERELSVLGDLVAGAASGDGRVAVVTGPPGIGKTALLAAVRDRASPRMQILASIGGELERDLPFGVVRQLFEPTLRASAGHDHADVFSGAARLAAPVFALGNDEGALAMLGDVVHGLYWLCANLADVVPLLLAVDDINWTDDASLRFLSHLARRITGLPILLLAAGRTGTTLDDMSVRAFSGVEVVPVHLSALSAVAVTTLVREQLGDYADDAFCGACATASGGNPFLLTEALANLKAAEVRPLSSEVARVANLRPQTISRTVLSRIAQVGPDAVRFARALAILGPTSRPRQLAEFANLSSDVAANVADALARDSIVTAAWPTRFVHPLVLEAVYGDMSAMQRAAEHKRAAHLLEGGGADVEQVAAQLLATEPEADPWVVAALRRSAGAALARGAPESAVTSLARARDESVLRDEGGPLDAELARALGMAGRPSEAAVFFREAIDHSETQSRKLELALELVFLQERAGRGQQAVEAAALARRFVDWDDPNLPVPVQAMLAAADTVAMRPPSAWTARLDRVVERSDAGSGSADRSVLSLIAFGRSATGDVAASEVARLARRAAAGPVPQRDLSLLVNTAGSALAICGCVTEALELLDRGIANARVLGNGSEFRYLAMLRSHVAWFAGELVDAEADARSGLNEVAGEQRTRNTSLAAAMLIDALVERGELADAAKVVDEYQLAGPLPADALIEHFLPMARGALRVAERRPAQALQDFLQCGQRLTSAGYVNPAFAEWRAGAIAAYVALGQIAAAKALAEENLHLARVFQAPRSIALALRMAGRATTVNARLECLAEAAALLADEPTVLERAHVLVEYGAELSRSGRREAALNPLRDGLELAARCAARPLVSTARKELRILGLRPRRTATTGRDALTASEFRVASLAAEGATNRQIAQALFVTTRTVEVHLTNTYRKLSIDNRGELRSALTQTIGELG